jgi:hypothetical protein|uniref:Uncharacterized protein n=1 Tax=Picea glauca TaxID=3330 RepID=A0A117NIW2_PICGL|nr:hypothetical protein ABT39_MTgene355 [Picea glauca]QHR86511.1 hypothetical protein Q903MT_gene513 [Picea sitchensis]
MLLTGYWLYIIDKLNSIYPGSLAIHSGGFSSLFFTSFPLVRYYIRNILSPSTIAWIRFPATQVLWV